MWGLQGLWSVRFMAKVLRALGFLDFGIHGFGGSEAHRLGI